MARLTLNPSDLRKLETLPPGREWALAVAAYLQLCVELHTRDLGDLDTAAPARLPLMPDEREDAMGALVQLDLVVVSEASIEVPGYTTANGTLEQRRTRREAAARRQKRHREKRARGEA